MPHYHRAYGLNFVSDTRLLPLADTVAHDKSDVTIRRNQALLGKYIQDESQYHFKEVEGGIVICFPKIAIFKITNGDLIEFQSLTDDEQAIRLYLLGSCIAAIWYQRHAYILHANVVNIDNKAVAIAAYSGSGKSTLAARFFVDGFPILSDDVCVLDKNLMAQPGYPYIKLWGNTLNELDLPKAECIRIRLQQDKYYFPIGKIFYEKALPLEAVYVLRKSDVDSVKARPIEGIAKMRALQYHSYRSQYLLDMQSHIQRRYWNDLLKLCAKVPVKLIARPNKGFYAHEILNFIVDDIRKMTKND